MTPEREAEVKAMVERTTKASGVPLKVEDPAVLAAVAKILRASQGER